MDIPVPWRMADIMVVVSMLPHLHEQIVPVVIVLSHESNSHQVEDQTVDISVPQRMAGIVEVVKVSPHASSSPRVKDQTVDMPVRQRMEDIVR